MAEIGILTILVCVPLALGFFMGKLIPGGLATGCLTSVFCAATPAVLMLALAQQADSITRAASLYVIPVFFVLMCIPAAAGTALGRRSKKSL
jgi:hypothetical protein